MQHGRQSHWVRFVVQTWADISHPEQPIDVGGNLNKRRGTRSWKSEHPDLELVHRPGALIDPEEEVRLRGNRSRTGTGRRGEGDPFNTPRRPHVGLGAQKKPGLAMIADADSPLSNMLDSERPFLKPIKFVRSTFTPFLFQRSEELPQPLSEEVGPDGRACCSGVNGIQRFFPADSEPEDEASNQLQEIDFADPGRIRAEIDAVAAVNKHGDPRTLWKRSIVQTWLWFAPPINAGDHKHLLENTPSRRRSLMTPSRSLLTGEVRATVPQEPTEALDQSANGTFAQVPDVLVVEEESPPSSCGSVDASVATPSASVMPAAPQIPAEVSLPKPPAADSCPPDAALTDNSPQLFVIDTERTRPFTKRLASDVILVDRSGGGEMPGEEEELIVYVVPIRGRAVHHLFQRSRASNSPLRYYLRERPPLSPWARLREEDQRERWHPKWETRRRGDSEVDRGTDGEGTRRGDGDEAVDEVSSGLGGMDLDPDVELCMDAMKGFLTSMGVEGSRFVTMDDIEDEARMRREDEEDQGGPTGSSVSEPRDEDEDEDKEEHEENEEEEAFNIEELLIAESEQEVNHMVDDNDNDNTPTTAKERLLGSSFQARLRKIRARGWGKLSKVARQTSDADHSDHPPDDGFAPRKGGAEAQLDNTATSSLDKTESNGNSSSATCTKTRTSMTSMSPWTPNQSLYPQKKASRPKAKPGTLSTNYKLNGNATEPRKLNTNANAGVDPFSNHKGGKKAHKAMLAASKLNPEDLFSMVPNAIVDMASLEAQIRRFVDDIGGKSSMALPAMDKASRKKAHELAAAFGLSSQSKGNGVRRYTTLMKTGIVKEGKVKAILKRFGNTFDRAYDRKNGGDSRGRLPRHREGDEVGKEAPKIGQSNIGFRMLASMCSEGDRIGGNASVGIEAPVTAIIKNSKLGLGATR
ncbi:hypothetical protein BU15DRAFT_67991 [Melanogaster broomeanus]|nr:hypothetical protein BU15DRAFT_67991 [Melanogaster broomeanus]